MQYEEISPREIAYLESVAKKELESYISNLTNKTAELLDIPTAETGELNDYITAKPPQEIINVHTQLPNGFPLPEIEIDKDNKDLVDMMNDIKNVPTDRSENSGPSLVDIYGYSHPTRLSMDLATLRAKVLVLSNYYDDNDILDQIRRNLSHDIALRLKRYYSPEKDTILRQLSQLIPKEKQVEWEGEHLAEAKEFMAHLPKTNQERVDSEAAYLVKTGVDERMANRIAEIENKKDREYLAKKREAKEKGIAALHDTLQDLDIHPTKVADLLIGAVDGKIPFSLN